MFQSPAAEVSELPKSRRAIDLRGNLAPEHHGKTSQHFPRLDSSSPRVCWQGAHQTPTPVLMFRVSCDMVKKSKSAPAPGKFVFRKGQSIGYADAVEDDRFLQQSFVDTGEIELLRDVRRPEFLVVGRTGSGKTALLKRLAAVESRVVQLVPRDLALTYIANSTILRFFDELGVNLDLFYQLLWRHIIAVEIVRRHFEVVDDTARDGVLARLRERFFGKSAKAEALQYLLDWGKSFWKETDYRVKEITNEFEQKLSESVSGAIGLDAAALRLGATGLSSTTASMEEKTEFMQRGQKVVEEIQIAKLSKVMELLDQDILIDDQKRYYIAVDQLDENWVSESIRYNLIRALLEAARDFNNRVRNVKIIIAAREDLVDRVFRYTRDSGFQEEKYRALQLPLLWDANHLIEIVDKRVNQLIREQYTSQVVSLKRLLPESIDKSGALQYMIDRTMYRPRDLIMFFNECMLVAQGKARISQEILQRAEGTYSLNRLRALADEWSADFPLLVELSFCIRQLPQSFEIRSVHEVVCRRLLDLVTSSDAQQYGQNDFYIKLIDGLSASDKVGVSVTFFRMLFRVGIVGVKPSDNMGVHWSFRGGTLVHLTEDARCHIHPAFYRVLDVRAA